MADREVAGVRRAITWLHNEAKKMNDPTAVMVLNNAAFHLGNALTKWRNEPVLIPRQSGTMDDETRRRT